MRQICDNLHIGVVHMLLNILGNLQAVHQSQIGKPCMCKNNVSIWCFLSLNGLTCLKNCHRSNIVQSIINVKKVILFP